MLTTILQYSTMDLRFLKSNLSQLSKFSDEIIVPICDHFFSGEKEDVELLNKTYQIASEFPKCSVFSFEWQGPTNNTGYYHNLSRALGTEVAKGDWILFVDADEIADDTFKDWFENHAQYTDVTYWMTCYWYFREPIYRSKSYEGCGLLIKKDICEWNINIRDERQQFHRGSNFVDGSHNHILANESPMMHHFSWVRTKDQMIKKISNWGHKNDTNWIDLIKEEFSRPFNGTDFIHKYQYDVVENKFNI